MNAKAKFIGRERGEEERGSQACLHRSQLSYVS